MLLILLFNIIRAVEIDELEDYDPDLFSQTGRKYYGPDCGNTGLYDITTLDWCTRAAFELDAEWLGEINDDRYPSGCIAPVDLTHGPKAWFNHASNGQASIDRRPICSSEECKPFCLSGLSSWETFCGQTSCKGCVQCMNTIPPTNLPTFLPTFPGDEP